MFSSKELQCTYHKDKKKQEWLELIRIKELEKKYKEEKFWDYMVRSNGSIGAKPGTHS